jgi:membrane protease YdiL (CAAX protease family)
LWGLGPGLHYALLGTVLVAIFAAQLWRRRTSLPLVLEKQTAPPNEDKWQDVEVLTWAMLGAQAVVLSTLSTALSLILLRLSIGLQSSLIFRSSSIVEAAVLLGICIVTVGRKDVTACLRAVWPVRVPFAILGSFIPIMLALLISASVYVPQRLEWAASAFGEHAPPAFFSSQLRFDPAWLLLIIAAFGEEFVFRGILQTKFVERYGLFRGLTLVSVLWGAFHFPLDRYSRLSTAGVSLHVFFRLAACVAIGFVLSWLTLRAGSILPATLAHGVSNILIYAGFFDGYAFGEMIRIAEWALLAYLLFPLLATECAPRHFSTGWRI